MSVILFPIRHAAERQPGVFVFRQPNLKNEPIPIVLSGIDAETQAAVEVELTHFDAALADVSATVDRIVALLRPFMVENVR